MDSSPCTSQLLKKATGAGAGRRVEAAAEEEEEEELELELELNKLTSAARGSLHSLNPARELLAPAGHALSGAALAGAADAGLAPAADAASRASGSTTQLTQPTDGP